MQDQIKKELEMLRSDGKPEPLEKRIHQLRLKLLASWFQKLPEEAAGPREPAASNGSNAQKSDGILDSFFEDLSNQPQQADSRSGDTLKKTSGENEDDGLSLDEDLSLDDDADEKTTGSQSKPEPSTDADSELDAFFEDLSSIEDADDDDIYYTPPKPGLLKRIRQKLGSGFSSLNSGFPKRMADKFVSYFKLLVALIHYLPTRFPVIRILWIVGLMVAGFFAAPYALPFLTVLPFWAMVPVMIVALGVILFLALPDLTSICLKDYFDPRPALIEILVILVDVAKVAKKNVLAIEDSLPSIENEQMRYGLRMVVDRIDEHLIVSYNNSTGAHLKDNYSRSADLMFWCSCFFAAFGFCLIVGLWAALPPGSNQILVSLLIATVFWTGCGLFLIGGFKIKTDLCLLQHRMIEEGVLMIYRGENASFIEMILMPLMPKDKLERYQSLKFSYR
jgi:flagellar motor component MotA